MLIDFVFLFLISWFVSGTLIGIINMVSFNRTGIVHNGYITKRRWFLKDFCYGILSVGSMTWEERYYMKRTKDRL